jgi:hypothetical protein
MLGEKDLIFLGAALIWAANRNQTSMPSFRVAVHEAEEIYRHTFKEKEEE